MNIKAGVISGFVATVVLSMVMLHLIWGTALGLTYKRATA